MKYTTGTAFMVKLEADCYGQNLIHISNHHKDRPRVYEH